MSEPEIYAAPGIGTELVGRRHVLTEIEQTARGRGSGVAIDRTIAYLFDVSGDLAVARAREGTEGG